MAYGISDQMELTLTFNGQEFPFSSANTLSYIHMASSVRTAVPHLMLCVTDNVRWLLGTGSLADGTQIQITLISGAKERAVSQTFDFFSTAFKEERTDSGSLYTIEAKLNVPKYLLTTTRSMLKMNSSEVLKTIASNCDMTFLGVGTNDSQVWISPNFRNYVYAAYVARRGYATANSCMMLGVDLDKTLLYRDITAMDNPVATLGLLDLTTAGVVPVVGLEPLVMSTASNLIAGYSYTTVEQNLTQSDLYVQQSAIGTGVNESGSLTMNAKLKSISGEGNTRYIPVDAGNVHLNFGRAYHQNRRVLSMFNSGVTVVTPVLTTLRLLDTVTLVTDAASQMDGGASKTYEGAYRISNRVIFVQPGRIAERLELVRRTMNSTLPNSVESGSNSILTTADQMSARTKTLEPPVSSVASFTPFDPGSLSGFL